MRNTNRAAIVVWLAVLFCLLASVALADDTLTLPENMIDVKAEAFYRATGFDTVVIPEGTRRIGSKAFADSSVKSVYVPSNDMVIEPDAFDGCDGLVMYGYGDTYAEKYAGYNGIDFVDVENDDFIFGYINCNFDAQAKTYYGIIDYLGNEANLFLPEYSPDGKKVTAIGKEAFYGRSCITTVVIPNGYEVIMDGAFRNCSSLTDVKISDSVVQINDDAFSGCFNLKNVKLSNGLSCLSRIFWNCSNLEEIVIPESVRSLNWTFSGCRSLSNITLPPYLYEIDSNTFYRCTSLKQIIIPDSVRIIHDNAFEKCTGLISVDLPNGLISLGNCFNSCSNLTRIRIPGSVTSLAPTFFNGLDKNTIDVYYAKTSYLYEYFAKYHSNYKDKLHAYDEWPEAQFGINGNYKFKISHKYHLEKVYYYEAELLEEYNGVPASDDTRRTIFYMDDKYNVVTDAQVLMKLYTMHMYAECENIINSGFNNWASGARIWGRTAEQFMATETVFRFAGATVGTLIKGIYTGGKSAIVDIANYIAGGYTDSDLVSSLLQMAFIEKQINSMLKVAEDAISYSVLNENGAYDYNKILIKLDLYEYCAVAYQYSNTICMAVIEEVLEKYESDWEVATYYLGEFAKKATSNASPYPEVKGLYTFFSTIADGKTENAEILDFLNDLLGLYDGYEVLGYSLGYLSGAVDIYEKMYNISADEIIAKVRNPYFITLEKILSSAMYQNQLKLAE